MKKVSLFLFCIAIIVISTSVVVCLSSDSDMDTPNTNVSDNTSKTEIPKTDAPKTDAPKTDVPKTDVPKTEAPKTDAPKTDAPKTDVPKTDAPKTDVPNNNNSEFDINQVTQKRINVPAICQYPELPTGCESVAATMVLQYYNVNITAEKFARNWLERSENFYSSNGSLYGPDPDKVFAGNPFNYSSYGCYAEPIVNAINRNSTNCTAQSISAPSLEQLCTEYIANDKPVLIWATMNMRESTVGNSWYLEDGTPFTWIAGEHCLVLVGYNDAYYFLNDPMSGSTVSYQKDIAEKRFAELGSQAVYISPNEM